MKSVKIFGKSISVLAIVGIISMGMVSAALLEYYGRITTTVNVEQAVLLDGEDYTTPILEEITAVGGDISYGADHYLRNNASVWILVSLDSEITGAPGGDNEGLTVYPEYKLTPSSGGATNVGDEDDIHFYFEPRAWSSFNKVSFDYNITTGPSERVPHVNMWLRKAGEEPVQITTWNGGNPPAVTSNGRATYTKTVFTLINGNAVTGYDDWEVREVRIQSGNPSEDPSPAGDVQVVYVSNVEVNQLGIINTIELPTLDYANLPGRIVEFRLVYNSAFNMASGAYTIEITVVPVGTIDESGVTIDGVVY